MTVLVSDQRHRQHRHRRRRNEDDDDDDDGDQKCDVVDDAYERKYGDNGQLLLVVIQLINHQNEILKLVWIKQYDSDTDMNYYGGDDHAHRCGNQHV